MNSLLNWLDDRTGARRFAHEAMYENIPGGAKWRYVFGSMLVFAFVTQAVTGIFLWMYYSAGSQNAWESVYWIETQVQGGWLLRGVHHFMAQAMVVLLPLHVLQVILARAYQAPREFNWWLGLILMLITLALGLTGYLLPWDQKGYWATKVATELMSLPPGGTVMQKVVVGGDEYGHATLTRFFALHAGVLPALLVFFLVLHIALFRKHGITATSSSRRPDQYFWPHQVFKDSFACLLMLAVVVGIVIYKGGADLGPPAEPTESYGAARPEWYFLFLFQLLKKFQSELVGAIVVPSVIMAFLFVMPLVARVRFGHVVNVVVIISLLGGAVYLTGEAWVHDNYARLELTPPQDPDEKAVFDLRIEESRKFHASVEQAEREMQRVEELIEFHGIPREGVTALQRNDPQTQGPRLFARHCASCHSYLDAEGHGIAASEVSAPNLFGIGSDAWFRSILSADEARGFASPDMFGNTAHADGDMAEFVADDLPSLDDEQKQKLDTLIAMLVDQANLSPTPLTDDARQAGLDVFQETWDSYACSDCHKLGDIGDLGSAPDLTGAYSYDWLKGFISNPSDDRFYSSENDRMPTFAAHPDDVSKNLLTDRELDLLIRYLRGEQ